jgi:hypothetical protein
MRGGSVVLFIPRIVVSPILAAKRAAESVLVYIYFPFIHNACLLGVWTNRYMFNENKDTILARVESQDVMRHAGEAAFRSQVAKG